MDKRKIDINCDVAEGVGNEEHLFPYITSCNIAGGGHAGDVQEIRRVVRLALKHNLKIGAHPGYPDRENFGRKPMDLPATALRESIRWQVENVHKILKEEGGRLNHIKAHGALYNQLVHDTDLCEIFLEALLPYGKEVKIYTPQGSALAEAAELLGYTVIFEAFADRVYEADMSLRYREHEDSLITDKKIILQQIISMELEHSVLTYDGQKIPIRANTYCLHGDTPGAEDILSYLQENLPEHGLNLM